MYLCIYTHKSRLGVQASPPPPQELSGPAGLPSAVPARGATRSTHRLTPSGSRSPRLPAATAPRPSHPLPRPEAPPRFPLHLLSHAELPPGTSGRPHGPAAPAGSAGSSYWQPPVRGGMFLKHFCARRWISVDGRPRAHLLYRSLPVAASLSVIKRWLAAASGVPTFLH